MNLFGEGRLRPLKESVDALGPQLAALSLQSAALSSQGATNSLQLESVRGQCEAVATDVDQLRKTVTGLVAALNAQAELIDRQVRQIANLESELAAREESMKQLRAGQIRLERQAASDLEEMRSTNAALARQLLLTPRAEAANGQAADRLTRAFGG
jgi:chromosome segregation ATPase